MDSGSGSDLRRRALPAGLGYHKDLQTRATFMEVLTKILQQGTEFDTLAETVLADRFERLVELVTMMGDQGELPIAMALANVVPGSQWVCSSAGPGELPVCCVVVCTFIWVVPPGRAGQGPGDAV